MDMDTSGSNMVERATEVDLPELENDPLAVAGETTGAVVNASAMQAAPFSGGPASLNAVLDVPVRVQAILGRARLSVDSLVQLAPGNVVELNRKVGEPVDIFVNDRLIARGEVVVIENALGVTLTEIVREEH